jgi:hypothetical protein
VAQLDNSDRDVQRARTLAHLFDDRFVDPVLGFLLPGVGDAISSLIGLYLVRVAIAKKLPRVVIARMLMNLAVDALLGLVPVAGDLLDFGFKANTRNAALLAAKHSDRRPQLGDVTILVGAGVVAAVAIALPLWLAVLAARAIFG